MKERSNMNVRIPPESHDEDDAFAHDIYYDKDRKTIGFGPTYGERSFNNQPVNSASLSDAEDELGSSSVTDTKQERQKIILDFVEKLSQRIQ